MHGHCRVQTECDDNKQVNGSLMSAFVGFPILLLLVSLDGFHFWGLPALPGVPSFLTDNNPQWYCGASSNAAQMKALEIELTLRCPKCKDTVNDCCKAHDDCYKNQEGKDNCDKKFCDCVDDSLGKCDESCQKLESNAYCVAVKEGADKAYEDAGKPQ
ncbi:phospholipase A2-like protein Y52B11A.8 [Ditylenchus destructor]|uniref:Phospholipase A2-like protein Y52B11A.8 n=1 Tax=Ditylenchus destructor TaxID=166010 RepID=A0AAD4MIP6_9BILA|nr:phospholipase A2-like protein Y52B11A.8 [Ditylenchus destructor]